MRQYTIKKMETAAEMQGKGDRLRWLRPVSRSVAFKELSAFRRITLWVLKGNDKAIRFYERVGFKADGTSAEIKLGTPAVELRMMLETQEENNGIH